MATTPPAQIRTEVHTPPTPLHGSEYHSSPSRYNTRSRKLDLTPKESATPKRRSQTTIPSPASDSQPGRYLSATTIISQGMLPTPVKTPKKTQPKPITARALFQDASESQRKKKKRNGFSLESFSESNEEPIQIHIDSRDHVPEPDTNEDNPFYSKKRSAPEPTRASKRQKKETRPIDEQVQDAIHKDDGMVYVFRGKKVFKRFDDTGDEEEVIDDDELGLLRDRMDGRQVGSLTTLTRKSIRPRRLFQDQLPPPADDLDIDTEIEEGEPEELEPESPSRTRRTRTKDVTASSSKVSPFASWRRIKSVSNSRNDEATPRGRKRTVDEVS